MFDSGGTILILNFRDRFPLSSMDSSTVSVVLIVKSCIVFRRCVCMHDTDYVGVDFGYFTEMDKLPVRGFALGDTGTFSEMNHHTLGPLLCYTGWYYL